MQLSAKEAVSRLRTFLVRGTFFAIPVAVTWLVVKFAVGLTDSWLGAASDALVAWIVPRGWLGPFGNHIPGLSLVLILLILLVLGAIASSSLGSKLLGLLERIVLTIPGARTVFSATKKVVDIFDKAGKTRAHQRVVFIEHVRGGLRVPAFVVDEVTDPRNGRKAYVVMVPSKPNPTSASVYFVPAEEAWDAGMTTDEALKWGISLGMATPPTLPFSGPSSEPSEPPPPGATKG